MQTDKLIYLEAMGIQTWQLKVPPPSLKNTTDWENLQNSVKNCTQCALSQSRTQTVFGTGSSQAELMIIGEAPGFYEDQQGEPFVGRAGQLLTAMLLALGLDRKSVFIANVLKCRPPQNRDPLPAEVAECTPFLEKQIEFIQPKVLLALGRISAHYLLKQALPMMTLRGKTHEYKGIPLIITYHPAYLLRSPKEKKRAFEDLQRLQSFLNSQ